MGEKKQMTPQIHIRDLEHLFALNLQTPLFSKLASLYYNNYEFDKAKKVCDIGLKNDPNNAVGQYIKAKILLIENKPIDAERILKNIIILDKNNINALLTLIEVAKSLNRNHKTINKYILQGYNLFPENKKIKAMNDAINTNNTKIKTPKVNKEKKIEETIIINEKMATQTMYKLMINQKKFEVAKNILETMKNKKDSNKSFIQREIKKLNTLTKKKQI
tara:strand:+ start:112 stop:768 length:657 start_codon:yes stop_codon:yes gene_type:complete